MAYSFSNRYAENLCKRIVLVQVIIKKVVTCFLEHSVDWRMVVVEGGNVSHHVTREGKLSERGNVRGMYPTGEMSGSCLTDLLDVIPCRSVVHRGGRTLHVRRRRGSRPDRGTSRTCRRRYLHPRRNSRRKCRRRAYFRCDTSRGGSRHVPWKRYPID